MSTPADCAKLVPVMRSESVGRLKISIDEEWLGRESWWELHEAGESPAKSPRVAATGAADAAADPTAGAFARLVGYVGHRVCAEEAAADVVAVDNHPWPSLVPVVAHRYRVGCVVRCIG